MEGKGLWDVEGDGVLGGMSAEPAVQELNGVDGVGAGIGEEVLVALGSSARMAVANTSAPVDAAIVGIVD